MVAKDVLYETIMKEIASRIESRGSPANDGCTPTKAKKDASI
jgi:hypothetical protein